MVLGKFMPLHRGHQHLIEFARSRVDYLSVLVCSLDREPIPGRLRYEWVEELYPDLNVVHVTDENPSEPHEHPEFWGIWVDTVRRAMPAGPDVVFTSESYGDELGRRLGARHIKFDPARASVPISATRIRANPYDCWEYIPPCVRAYYARRVAIIGAESTGKTTLAAQLAQHYATVWVPEFARGYLAEKNARCELADIPHIARGQAESEDALAREANRVLFCDTELITTTVWSDHYFGECPEWIKRAAEARDYGLYLLTDIDVPWVADPQRDRPHMRDYFRELFLREVRKRSRPYALISGSYKERFRKAVEAVDSLFIEDQYSRNHKP